MVGADETGTSGLPEVAPERTRETGKGNGGQGDGTPSPPGRTYPAGLTKEGRAAFRRLSEENTIGFETRLEQMLDRQWVELHVSGSPEHTRDRVIAAATALQTNERQEIIDEVEQRIRAEVTYELQQTSNLRQDRTKSAGLYWRIGGTLAAGASAVGAMMAVPDSDAWAKWAVVATTMLGWLIGSWRGK